MLNKILWVVALGIVAGFAPVDGRTEPPAPARVRGSIIAARVRGHVEASSQGAGTARTLRDGDSLSDGTRIVTSPGASVILVFSNGATVDVAGDTRLDIDQFVQDPFAGDVAASDLKREPSPTSVTRLDLERGELVGKVVHLNVDKGSDFTVQTPVGAAGIRGTTFRIVFRPGPGGKAFLSVTTAEGTVVFTGPASGPVSIPQGRAIDVTFAYTPPAPGAAAPVIATVTVGDASVPDLQQIYSDSDAIISALTGVVFTSPGTAAPAPLINNAPSPPVVPPPQTTPGAGTP